MMTITEFVEAGYFYYLITAFGCLLVLGAFLTSIIRVRKFPVIQLLILLLFIGMGLFKQAIVWIPQLNKITEIIPLVHFDTFHLDFYSTAICIFLVLISRLNYLCFTRNAFSNNEIYTLAPSYLGRPIYAYMNRDGKILSYTEDFFSEVNFSFKNEKKWYKKAYDFTIDDAKYKYNDFLLKLKEQEDNSVKWTFKVKKEDFSLEVEKNTIEKNDDIIGYVFTSPHTAKASDGSDGFIEVIGQLSTPYAYYNDDKRGVDFVINKTFKELLGLRGQSVGYEDLKKYVYGEDIQSFENSVNTIDGENVFIYRLQTNDGVKSFKEIKKYNEDKVTIIITLNNQVEEKQNTKQDLFAFYKNALQDEKEFGACLISINGINSIIDQFGVDVTKELVNKYVEYLEKTILGKNDIFTKISDMEYCIAFSDVLVFDGIVRDISKGTSNLLKYNIQYNDVRYELNNIVGLVYSEHISSSEELMNALDEALAFANQESYDKNYCIYSPSRKHEETKITEYKFEDLIKIDLDNSFLDDDNK